MFRRDSLPSRECVPMSVTEDMALRFWRKVRRGRGCWIWLGGRQSADGYGKFSYRSRFWGYSHRFAWTVSNGPIPQGAHVLHRCDNPICVRPSHLFAGTNADNVADMMAKGRQQRANGEHASKARLTGCAVRAIRARRAAGESTALLAAEFGIGQRQIYYLAGCRTWNAFEYWPRMVGPRSMEAP